MTMEMLANNWEDFVESLNGVPVTIQDVVDFCNMYATSYEEYNYIYELIADSMDF